jgi:mono/diheme cytochrome c family protein
MGQRRVFGRSHATAVASSLALLMALVPAIGAAQDARHGRELAVRWCANCHIVTRSATTATAAGLPSFPKLASLPTTTDASLRRAMTASHSRMPDFALTKREQDDLIAYIFSLREH